MEFVHDGGLGLAADLPPAALAVFGVPHRQLAAPWPRAVTVAFGVTTVAAMLEGDPCAGP
jgi:hypothetical protein